LIREENYFLNHIQINNFLGKFFPVKTTVGINDYANKAPLSD
tara:strand:- start:788 stop:913 length:126 start_codon:yes stop_codon:yes gene_type:complete